MPWTERQQALLQGMGLKVWSLASTAGPEASTAPATRSEAVEPPLERPAERPVSVVKTPPAPSRRAAGSPVADVAVPVAASPSAPAGRADGPVATMDWPALRAAVAGCQACALCESRKNTVFGVGNPAAEWMIVGEAPGEQEDKQGEPFVGAAGQLLDAMLKAIGLTRSEADAAHQVFIANTLKCRPPRNRNPLPEELAQCTPYLQRQIALVQPRVLLAMGRFAIQQLLHTEEPVGRLRGKVHEHQGIPVIVTYHPAYLLRQPTEKAKAWQDLLLAVQVYRRSQGG